MAATKKAATDSAAPAPPAIDEAPATDGGTPDVAPATPTKSTRSHYTVCTVVGSAVVSEGRNYDVGTVAEFPNSDVVSLPEYLIPVEENA